MSWFKRTKQGITTATSDKKETPDGLWFKCPKCKKVIPMADMAQNAYVCSSCNFHTRIGSKEYFSLLFDGNVFTELFTSLAPADPLNFVDTKPYSDRLDASFKKTGLKDAIVIGSGKLASHEIIIGCMDFNFIGGSMGSVVGEKIARAIRYCIDNKMPLLIISKSGGARMMEAGLSLMQMAKTSAMLTLLSKAKLPYFSLLTDPTTGGVTASFGMLGDLNMAEPGALIGFAGPRVIKETIGKDLPQGFQTAEFLLEHGFVDMIVLRTQLKKTLASLIDMFSVQQAGKIKTDENIAV